MNRPNGSTFTECLQSHQLSYSDENYGSYGILIFISYGAFSVLPALLQRLFGHCRATIWALSGTVVLSHQHEMEPEDCNECSRCNGPVSLTKEDWARCAPIIKNYYLNQGWRLPKIRQEMHRTHNFHCKERQYKTHFKNTPGYLSKRLRSEQYHAMAVVAQAETQSVHFRAPRGGRQVDITLQQIHKELGRCRKRRSRGLPSKADEMTLDKAKWILDSTGIEVVYGPGVDSVDAARLLPHFEAPASPDGSESSLSVSTPVDGPASPVDFGHPYTLHQYSYSNYSLHTSDQSDGRLLSTTGMGLLVSQQPLQEDQNDFDLTFLPHVLALNDCSMLPINANPFGEFDRSLPPPQSPLNKHKQRTVRWASPFYMACVVSDKATLHNINELKVEAIQEFKCILNDDPANRYILPCLNEVVTVLGANEKHAQLREFLSESCRVIESLESETSLLATPFRYCLAVCMGDTNAKEQYGSMLSRTHDYMVPIFGGKHPNLLVNTYYYAWHLMEKHEFDEVIKLLRSRLYAAQKLFDGHNLMIVNCMAMLGRAYTMTDQDRRAHSHYTEALKRLYHHPHLRAFRLGLVLRLAVSEAKLGFMPSAKSHANDVVKERLDMFGYVNQTTWAAIDMSCRILLADGLQEDADALWAHHEQAYAHEQNRQWYEMQGFPIPGRLSHEPVNFRPKWSASLTTRSLNQLFQSHA